MQYLFITYFLKNYQEFFKETFANLNLIKQFFDQKMKGAKLKVIKDYNCARNEKYNCSGLH